MEQQRARQVGAAAICCALVIRLFGAGLPGILVEFLSRPRVREILLFLETGRRPWDGGEGYLPDFAESPPAAPVYLPLPGFSGAAAVTNTSGRTPDLEELLGQPLTWDLRGEGPKVLILHTHATESYSRREEPYRESAPWRTTDPGYNMIAIGDLVARELEAEGIGVLHVQTLHDHPSYNGSYGRARETMETVLAENPQIALVLDLHRDASEGPGGQMRPRVTVAGESVAQLMLVLGTNYETYQENLSLGLKLQAQLEHQAPGITRPLQLRPSRFNQDLSPGALLIEVGAAGNTHEEARRAAHQLAQAITALASGVEGKEEEG